MLSACKVLIVKHTVYLKFVSIFHKKNQYAKIYQWELKKHIFIHNHLILK